jgi:hypothetical protein
MVGFLTGTLKLGFISTQREDRKMIWGLSVNIKNILLSFKRSQSRVVLASLLRIRH